MSAPGSPSLLARVRALIDQAALALEPLGRSLNVLGVLALLVAWFVVPGDHCLVRPDLVPWSALCASLTLALQGGRLGLGPHPQLPVRTSRQGQLALRLASALIPQALLRVFELGTDLHQQARPCKDAIADLLGPLHLPASSAQVWENALLAVLLWVAIAALRWLARDEGRTAWKPPHPHPVRYALVRVAILIACVGGAVALGVLVPDTDSASLFSAGALASAGFLLTGWLWNRSQDLAQQAILRERARSAGMNVRASVDWAAWAVALAVPLAGFLVLDVLVNHEANASEGTVAAGMAVYLGGAAMVVWPMQRLAGWSLQLHEVVPVGEAVPTASSDPGADTTPPRGTLQFNPQRIQRVGLSIPWMVPLDQSAYSTGVYGEEPLWLVPPVSPLRHVIGPAVVTTAGGWPVARQVQLHVLGGDDLAPLVQGDNQERRLVVYTQDPVGGSRGSNACLQEVDPSTRSLVITDGAVIILGSGLVSQLYEVEFCALLYEGDPAPDDALPQFQDGDAP